MTHEVRSASSAQRDELVRVVAYAVATAVAMGQRLSPEDARAIADAIRAGLAQYQSEGR